MKKLLSILVLTIMMALPAAARDKVYRSANVLPAPAQQLIKKNFGKAAVNRVKVDSNIFGHKDYEVVMSNGVELEFDNDGNWKEIDCGHSAVPQALIPAAITTYVKRNHGNAKIVKIDKDSNDYEIELQDGTDLKFDRSGKFLRYDD